MEFKSLSDKIRCSMADDGYILTKNVKEFIRLEDDLILDYRKGKITFNTFCKERHKLAGPAFTDAKGGCAN